MKFSPKKALSLALSEAHKGIGYVEPNPPVGCVILSADFRLLSSAYHEKYGEDHAEVKALKKIKDKKKLNGAHIFVTLQPCHHKGKTPPCSKALAKHPISSLTYGAKDPFTKKGGLNFLRKKGVKIIQSPYFKKEMENLIRPFKFSVLNKRPFVSLKIACSVDGVVAGEKTRKKPLWITSLPARRHGHFLRAMHSAVLIGQNTLLADNPRLDIRVKPYKGKQNKVVILDPSGKSLSFLPRSRVLKAHSAQNIIICCSDKISKKAKSDYSALGVKIRLFKTFENRQSGFRKNFALASLLKNLYQKEGIKSLLVEGGAFCWSRFFKEHAAQRLYLYMSPDILGKGLYWSKYLSDLAPKKLQFVKLKALGRDFLWEGDF